MAFDTAKVAEAIRKRVYYLWVQSRKSSRTSFGTTSFQIFLLDAIAEELSKK